MLSKRSFFSPALFKKNLARFWPLWSLASLAGAMIPLWLLLGLISHPGTVDDIFREDFVQMLYYTAAYGVPYLTIVYAALCAMLVWGYLMNGRAVGLMHTLPVDRNCLFLTNTLSGLAMLLIPYAVTGVLICIEALIWGFMDFGAVCLTALSVLLLSVTYFGMATLCAMITGNSFAVPALYVLMNFIAPLVTLLFNSLYTNFFLGLPGTDYNISHWLSPPIKIGQSFRINRETVFTDVLGNGHRVYRLEGLHIVALYALAGVLMLVLAWLLYRRRHSETAGDVIVFPWLRPVFRYGLAALSALSVGRVFYALFWQEIFQKGRWYDVLPMCVCLAAAGILGYYIASMLLEKSLRVFKGSWKGIAVVCAGVLVLGLWLRFDLFGLEGRVPDAEDVASVSISSNGMRLTLEAGEDASLIRDVVALHQAIVDDRDYVKGQGYAYATDTVYREERRWTSTAVIIVYTLKNGATLERSYTGLWVFADRAEDPDTYDGKLSALLSSPEAARTRFEIPAGYRLDQLYLYGYLMDYSSVHINGADHQRQVLEALERDWAAGHIPGYAPFQDETRHYRVTLTLDTMRTGPDGDHSWGPSRELYLYTDMTETLGVLEKLGYVSAEDMVRWNEDLAMWYGDELDGTIQKG